MQQYIIRRMLLNGVVLLLVATMVFAALRVDSDQVVNRFAAGCFHAGEDTQQCKNVAKNLLGLDESIPKQYVDFMKNTLTLDFGKTFSEKKPVLHEITSRAAPSIELGLLQIVVALLVGVPVGVISAIRQDKWVDYILRFVAIFFLGIAIIYTNLLRPGGWPQVGAIVAIMGAIDAMFAPLVLKKAWDEQDQ